MQEGMMTTWLCTSDLFTFFHSLSYKFLVAVYTFSDIAFGIEGGRHDNRFG
jgi:hypothetical protein